ncbi:hypothetical protein [Chitinophaga sancti]|uniref:hypothetical protein n=1 Tax=Chitinophaga sancti TaxID=1004 RepID=UPI003F7B0EFC
MQFRLLLAGLLLWSIVSKAQDGTLFIVDSVEVEGGLNNLSPDKIAFMNVVKSPTLQAKYGAKAENAIIFIETKAFARKRYNRLFSELSPAFEAALKKYGSDSVFQYILDGVKIDETSMNMLAALEKKSIVNLVLVDKETLKRKYEVKEKDKKVGVVITSK